MLLEVRGLRAYYRTLTGYVKAVNGVDLQLGEEILGIVGESGSGKSTLASSIILPKPPLRIVEGEVLFRGERIVAPSDTSGLTRVRYRHISIIPQYAMDSLSPTRKVYKIIKDLARGLGDDVLAKARRRLRRVNLPERVLDMYPVELSGGMKQRTVIVISTLLDPEVLIADEVTSALDVTTQRAVLEMLRDFKDSGIVRSIMIITHDIASVYQVSDTLAIMYAGRIVEHGPAEKVIRDPLHPYAQALISSIPKIGIHYKMQKLKGIPGNPPSLRNPPSGCAFHPRCSRSLDECSSREPRMVSKDGRRVACLLYE